MRDQDPCGRAVRGAATSVGTLSRITIGGLLFSVVLAGEAGQLGPITTCEPLGAAKPICGFQNPEDLVVLPGEHAILVSEYGGMEGGTPGRLSLLVLDTEERRELFSGGDADAATPVWGDPACPGPPGPAFSPHGIHLSAREDGSLQLLAVQHGGRESVEFFEVAGSQREWHVMWRGCVAAPDDAWLNSVAALPGGGFVTTKMITRQIGRLDLSATIARGPRSGHVLEWLPGRGFEVLSGSEGEMPNGIEASTDGRLVFVNVNGGGHVRRIVRETGEVAETARLGQLGGLDNARWAPDGRLLVASLGGPGMAICRTLESGACPAEFRILAVDPESLEAEELYRNQGPPMGAGTGMVLVGQELFVGSFAGDRILRVALD